MKKLLFLLGFFSISLFCWIYLNAPYKEIEVKFTKDGIPIVKVDIQGEKFPLQFSLSSKYPLFLNENALRHLRVLKKGEASWKDHKGTIYKSSLFQIPKISLGNLTLKNCMVASEFENGDSECLGSFAWPFHDSNLLLDFPHHKILPVRNIKKLSDFGFDLKKMNKIKCKITPQGIIFNTHSHSGDIKLALSPYCSKNAINRSLFKDGLITKCKIEDKDVKIVFHPIDLFDGLEFDGFLGTEFLKEHVVFVDAQDEYLYFGEAFGNSVSQKKPHKIPITFTSSGIPAIDLKVSDETYKVLVDLGSSSELILPESFQTSQLDCISTETLINGVGKMEKINRYSLPECKIGNAVLKNLFVTSKNLSGVDLGINFHDVGTLKKPVGNLGYPILYRTNLFLDLQNSYLGFIRSQQDLKIIGISLNDYEKIPFELGKWGLIANVKTDLGILRFLIDTGASVSIAKKDLFKEISLENDALNNSCFPSKTFILGNVDFGGKILYPFEISSKIDSVDAVLGMDFLGKHPFYIDFQENWIWIKKPSPR